MGGERVAFFPFEEVDAFVGRDAVDLKQIKRSSNELNALHHIYI